MRWKAKLCGTITITTMVDVNVFHVVTTDSDFYIVVGDVSLITSDMIDTHPRYDTFIEACNAARRYSDVKSIFTG